VAEALEKVAEALEAPFSLCKTIIRTISLIIFKFVA